MKAKHRAITPLFAALLAVGVASTAYAQGGTWATKEPMPTARNTFAFAEANGILYAIGGGPPFGQVNEAYDPATDSWATKASMPTARNLGGNTQNAVVNGIVYVIGGNPPGTCTTKNEAYDPASNTWTTKAPMPTPRCHLAVVALNGLIYALGGTPASGSPKYSILEIYNPATNTWTTGASMPTGRQSLGIGVVNGVLYAIGGWNPDLSVGGELDVVEAYNPVTNTWTTKAPMPTARSALAIGEVNGLVYAMGGIANSSGTVHATVEAYDPATDTWTSQPPMPTARAYLSAGAVNGIVYAVGGSALDDDDVCCVVVGTNEAFTPVVTVGIDIKPGGSPNPINPKSNGKIPVAILSSASFNAVTDVDTATLTFGHSGDESSLAFCNPKGEDVDGDGRRDLVCHFLNDVAAFQSGDTKGFLKGSTHTDVPIQGSDSIRIVGK